jgi:hypothetical protein
LLRYAWQFEKLVRILSFTELNITQFCRLFLEGAYWLRFWAQVQLDEHNKNLLSSLSTKLEMVSLEDANGGWKQLSHLL